jgi:hypothetical protein
MLSTNQQQKTYSQMFTSILSHAPIRRAVHALSHTRALQDLHVQHLAQKQNTNELLLFLLCDLGSV